MALILCGFFCAGKTSVGRICAEKLSLPFYDTDRLIEARFCKKKSCSDIWQEVGEEAFRDLETEVISSLKKEPAIVATGGGSLLREENREYLKKLGVSVYLKASLPILYQRVLKRGLPAYLDKKRPFAHFEEIALLRFSIYELHCRYIIETHEISEKETAEKILNIYGRQ